MTFKNSVIYQIYPKSFKDSTGDGIGDLRGIIDNIPYIASLGVDYVWFNPFFPSPGKDNGYDVSDYCAIDPDMGTLEDFDDLVSALEAQYDAVTPVRSDAEELSRLMDMPTADEIGARLEAFLEANEAAGDDGPALGLGTGGEN